MSNGISSQKTIKRPIQKELEDLKIKLAIESAKEEIILLTKDSENIFETLAILNTRRKQLDAYNTMKKAIVSMGEKCEHDYSKILAFEQNDQNEIVYLRRCGICYKEKIDRKQIENLIKETFDINIWIDRFIER